MTRHLHLVDRPTRARSGPVVSAPRAAVTVALFLTDAEVEAAAKERGWRLRPLATKKSEQ